VASRRIAEATGLSEPFAKSTEQILQALALALADRRVIVFVVCPRETNLKQLAELTDGLFFELSNKPSPEEMRRLTRSLTSSIPPTLSGAPR